MSDLQAENKNLKSSFAGSSLYLFAAKFFPALAIFAAILYCSHSLNTREYAQYQNFWTQLIFLGAIACIGFPAFIITYSGAQVKSLLRRISVQQYILYSFFLIVLSLFFGALQYRFNDNSFPLAAIFFFLFAGLALTDALLTAFRAYKWLIGINIMYAAGFLSIHYYVISDGSGFLRLLTPIIVLLFIRLVLNLCMIRKAFFATDTAQTLVQTDWLLLRKLWLQLGVNDIIQVFFRWIDKFIFSFILAEELFAVYTNATIEIAFLPLIFSAVSSAAIQHWAHQHNNKTVQSQIKLLHYSSAILSSIVFPLFFFLLFFREEFLVTLFSEKYIEGVWIFVCAQLVLPVRAYPFTALLQSHHRGDIINKGALIDFIMACVLMYPLYLLAGLPGVALSFVISTYWQAAYYLLSASKILNISVSKLLPVRALSLKIILYALLFGVAWLTLFYTGSSRITTFWSGIVLLAITGILSLLYEWKKEKTNEHTNQ